MLKRIFSGIQPTGMVHIGNYLGAIRNWVKLSREYDCIYSIVDYHALTVRYSVEEMESRIWDAILDNVACGIDAEVSRLFIQSSVPEHTELAWIFGTVASMGLLERMTQFKDKSRDNRDNINVGLFTYPVLQTADILLYKAGFVPVGRDQVQHIELARELARSFNSRYGGVFPEPQALLSDAPRILGLCARNKMSKSLGNYIGLNECKADIEKKLMKAVTDENRKRRSDAGEPGVCNIFTYHKFFTSSVKCEEIELLCRSAGIGCVDCKRELVFNMWEELYPIQERRRSLNLSDLKEQVRENGEYCRGIARATMLEVKEALGLWI